MKIEEKLRDCEYFIKQVNHFNPDPYYVDYFFRLYLQSINDIYDEIFEEANRSFGLFISGKSTKKKFENKAIEKDDNLALKFLSWFEENYKNEHSSSYPNFIQETICFFKKYNCLPKTVIKIQAEQKRKDDVFQLIKVGLTNGKIKSKENLEIEIRRQMPVFLEVINQKRKINNEPKVNDNQIIASAYLEMKKFEDFEIKYSCEIYLPVLKRFVNESRNKIKELTRWVD
jgi:hypothetical protein